MAIVDTFTKLIFDVQEQFSSAELLIIEAFRLVDPGVARDNHSTMGQYLRALGVAEMIRLVAQVQAQLSGGLQAVSSGRGTSILDRRAH
jgi:hypothetical protein